MYIVTFYDLIIIHFYFRPQDTWKTPGYVKNQAFLKEYVAIQAFS